MHIGAPAWICSLVLLCGTALACDRPAEDAPPSREWTTTGRDSAGWWNWEGHGIRFATPPQATIRRPSRPAAYGSGWEIIAFVGGADVPDFVLSVTTVPITARATLHDWVGRFRAQRDSIRARETAPFGPPIPRRVGPFEALELQPFCERCEAHEVYLQSDSLRFVFSYMIHTGMPLTSMQQDSLYERVLRSVTLQ